jgi:hypothetical protein
VPQNRNNKNNILMVVYSYPVRAAAVVLCDVLPRRHRHGNCNRRRRRRRRRR